MEKIKLYTEKELKRIATISYLRGVKNMPSDIEFNIANATPIKLPTDEEIEASYKFEGAWTEKEIMQKTVAFKNGVRWALDYLKQQADNGN